MIDKVMICGLRRAGNLVPEMEIRQMIGRAGRSYEKDAVGNVIVLTSEEDFDSANDYLYGDLPSVVSKMDNIEDLGFHILPSIYSKEVYDDVTAYEWYRRSLAHYQSVKFPYESVFDFLSSHEMIKGDDKRFVITELGKISCKYYFSPLKIFIWKEKMERVMLNGCWKDDYAIAWMLSTGCLGVNVNQELMSMIDMNSSFGCEYDEKEEVALYYCMLAGYRPKELKYAMREYNNDMDRIIKVFITMDEIYDWGVLEEIEILYVRIKEKMDYNMAKLAIETDIRNKTLLYKLMEFGVTCFQDIKDNIDKIKKYGDRRMIQQLEDAFDESL